MFQVRPGSAELVTKELDLLAYGAVVLVVHRFKRYRPEVVDLLLEVLFPVDQSRFTHPNFIGNALKRGPPSPQLYKTRFRIVILHNASFVAQNDIIAVVKL